MTTPSPALPPTLADGLARLAVQGEWSQAALVESWSRLLGTDEASALASRLLDLLPQEPLADAHEPETASVVARLLRALPALPVRPMDPSPAPSTSTPTRPAYPWRFGVPQWNTLGELAVALDLTRGELEWFADAGHWLRHAAGPLRHYRCHAVPTSHGGTRLIEAPKPRLRELQRRLLRRVLRPVPTHLLVHGFVPGRSALTAAAAHAGHAVLVRADLQQFFASVTAPRVRGTFSALGYPEPVAAALTGLCTTRTPVDELREVPTVARERLRRSHLPQGAPTSPALANLVAHRLDRRVAGLAAAQGCTVTRYADDLAFSGPPTTDVAALLRRLSRMVVDEGFTLHPDKTTVARSHQQQRLLGLVVNETPALARRERDALRALLHNCAVTGPEPQNRDGHADFRAHLQGRITWASAGDPARLARLTAMLEQIPW